MSIYEHNINCRIFLLRRSSVGTLFALPWYLTWFGHSLNSYRNVVRLYDYFLASPFLMPLYVTVAIVLYREDDIFKEDCDMASLHCLLSQVSTHTTPKVMHILSFDIFQIRRFSFFCFSCLKICPLSTCYRMQLNSIKNIHQMKSNWKYK